MKPFLNNLLNIFHFRRQTVFFAVLGAVFVVGLFVYPSATHAAGVTDYVAQALAGLFGIIFQYVLSPILTMILSALTGVAEYNKIITNKTIIDTWGVVRDIVNMFFIFAILLIAFSTILRIHQYEAKQLLPKLVLYAVLVNFSLTICGLFIDFAQVFTLTFLNAFASGAVNNFVSITKILDYNSLQGDTMSSLGLVLGGYILGLILMVVTIVTLGAALLIFLVRIVYLWILSILSPFAFVLPIIPGGQGYANQWWTMFSKQVITGPLLAFFIWLSLTVLANQNSIANDILNQNNLTGTGTIGVKVGGTVASQPDFLINYIIAIAMLFIGLMLTSQMGGAAGKIAGGASNWMQRSGTGFITGRLGPTPMRWARERYGSWRGQRESIRKEKVSRFGQGASALQDWAINKNVGHALSQIYKAPAGAIGRGIGRYAKQVHRGLGGSEESSIGRGLRTTSEWRPGQKDRWRAMERVEKYTGKKTSEDINTYTTAARLDLINNPKELRDRIEKETNPMVRVATALRLMEMRNLGEIKEDFDFEEVEIRPEERIPAKIKTEYDYDKNGVPIVGSGRTVVVEPEKIIPRETEWVRKRRGIVSETTEFLDRAPEMKQKFDDLMKKSNQKAAMFSSIYQRDKNSRTANLEIGEHISDAKQGKIDLSAIDASMVKVLDASLGGKAGAYFTELARAIRDTKEMVRIFGSINEEVRSEYMNEVDPEGLSGDMRIAFGKATGHFQRVFDFKERDKVLPDGTIGKELYTEDGSAEKFMSRKENRALLEKSHGTSWTKDLLKFMHENWLQYEMTGAQWENILKDPVARDTIFKNGSKLVDEIKGKLDSYNLNTKYGYGMNRLRNTVMMSRKSDKYENSEGKLVEAYEINSENPIIREAAQKALENQIMQNRITPERLEGIDLEIEIADPADSTKIIKKRNDNLIKAMTKFSHGQLAKMMLESQERGEKIISYMIDNSEANKSRLKRLPNDSNTVHFLDEKYIGDNKDYLDQNLSIRQALEKLKIITN